MARDEFSSALKNMLAKRASFVCSNPECRSLTIAPSDADTFQVLYIGKAAHISAASRGGPRYEPSMSQEERRSIDNAIFLCSSCADMIDCNSGSDYTIIQLRKWKEEHESWVRQNLNRRVASASTSQSMPCIHIEPGPIHNFDVGCRPILSIKVKNVGTAPAYDCTVDVSAGILPYPLPFDYPMPGVADSHDSVCTLMPFAEVVGSSQFDGPLSTGQAEQVLDGSRFRLYIGGTVRYQYPIGSWCRRNFLLQTGGSHFVESIQQANLGNNSGLMWHFADRFNGIISECEK